ncbi:MAG: 2-amino-4-hydroxy-6-hydroxymethyldihydropteridine diphosphokinase [Deltaproteobacteria bacterium]|nr:2-amino-4-hydroxy-6-hydroxymethyldihydropteridine diphosphokinase [Deltaproteobacteria bacterium]
MDADGKPEPLPEYLIEGWDICLGLGSNIGNTEDNLLKALSLIKSGLSGAAILGISSVYLSSPVGNIDQPYFLNCAAILRLSLQFQSGISGRTDYAVLCGRILSFLKDVEKNMGRKKEKERYMPRVIDIDMLFVYDNAEKKFITLDLPELKLPHPEIFKRRFVLEPILDLDLDLLYNLKRPFDEESIKKALERLDNSYAGAFQKISYYGKFDKKMTRILR